MAVAEFGHIAGACCRTAHGIGCYLRVGWASVAQAIADFSGIAQASTGAAWSVGRGFGIYRADWAHPIAKLHLVASPRAWTAGTARSTQIADPVRRRTCRDATGLAIARITATAKRVTTDPIDTKCAGAFGGTCAGISRASECVKDVGRTGVRTTIVLVAGGHRDAPPTDRHRPTEVVRRRSIASLQFLALGPLTGIVSRKHIGRTAG